MIAYIDSGSRNNIITVEFFEKIREFCDPVGKDYYPSLVTYANNKPLEVVGALRARVKVENYDKVVTANFYAVKGAKINLMGYHTAKALKTLLVGEEALRAYYHNIFDNVVAKVHDLSLFDDDSNASIEINEFPKIPNVELRLDIDTSVVPKFRNFCIGQKHHLEDMRKELREYVQLGIIRKVNFPGSSWVNPSMMVPKKGGKWRLCVDMTAANKAIRRKFSITMPTLKQMEEAACGKKWFAKLDITKAFHHIALAEESKYITTFRTPFGYFQFNRMPFGLNVAPEFFQTIIEGILAEMGISGVHVYIDDILILAESENELMEKLQQVKQKLQLHNLSINAEKTEIKEGEIEFLGFILSTDKVTVTNDRVSAIATMSPPDSFTLLRSFLGKINFLNSFIPSLAEISQPLWQLSASKKDNKMKFLWEKVHQQAFDEIKKLVVSNKERCHFNSEARTYLITDASDKATSAILFQVFTDEFGKEHMKVVEYASKLLSEIQKRYPQFQRELLGIVIAITHFRRYLCTTKFTLLTDLEAAEALIKQNLCKHKVWLNRHDRWILELSEFDFDVVHIPGKLNVADALSRLATHSTMNEDESFDITCENLFANNQKKSWLEKELARDAYHCHLSTIKFIEDTESGDFMTCEEVRVMTSRDVELSAVIEKISKNEELLSKWKNTPGVLWVDKVGLLRHDDSIVLPKSLRQKAIDIAHSTHFGAQSTYEILHDYVYWPGMDSDTRKAVKSCEICIKLGGKPEIPPMKSVVLPEAEWQHLAADIYTAPSMGVKLLVMEDYFSRKLVSFVVKF